MQLRASAGASIGPAADAGDSHHLRVDARRVVRGLLAAVAVVNVLNAISIAVGAGTERSRYFLLALEGNPSTWLTAAVLAATALAAWAVGAGRTDARTWHAVAGIFLLMSLDEVGTFHEWLGAVPLIPGVGTRGWAGAGVVLAALVGLRLFRWVLTLDAGLRLAMVAGAVTFLGGAVGFEVVAGEWESSHGRDTVFWLLSTIEENLELVGVLVVLRALLDHLGRRPAPLAVRVTP